MKSKQASITFMAGEEEILQSIAEKLDVISRGGPSSGKPTWREMIHQIASGQLVVTKPSRNIKVQTRERKMSKWHLENSTNSTGFLGVSYQKKGNVYVARIRIEGKQRYCGCAKTAKEAAEIYDAASMHHFGDNAVTNFEY